MKVIHVPLYEYLKEFEEKISKLRPMNSEIAQILKELSFITYVNNECPVIIDEEYHYHEIDSLISLEIKSGSREDEDWFDEAGRITDWLALKLKDKLNHLYLNNYYLENWKIDKNNLIFVLEEKDK